MVLRQILNLCQNLKVTCCHVSATSYHVHVKTGDISNAGTNANVFLIMFGEKGDSGKLQLRQSASFKNKFERNKTDIFTLEATNIGKVGRLSPTVHFI